MCSRAPATMFMVRSEATDAASASGGRASPWVRASRLSSAAARAVAAATISSFSAWTKTVSPPWRQG
jgi:hypothetical protein